MLIKCGCGRKFPFNPDKHVYDPLIYCPWCRNPHKNERSTHPLNLQFLRSLRENLQSHIQRNEARKFLDQYCRTTPVMNGKGETVRWNYSFSLNRWMKGQRPSVTLDEVRKVVGAEIGPEHPELKWLSKLGVALKVDK